MNWRTVFMTSPPSRTGMGPSFYHPSSSNSGRLEPLTFLTIQSLESSGVFFGNPGGFYCTGSNLHFSRKHADRHGGGGRPATLPFAGARGAIGIPTRAAVHGQALSRRLFASWATRMPRSDRTIRHSHNSLIDRLIHRPES